ncbi:MAG: T9SS type A sorting domain-containing protein [Ignavibacteriaceae bacterium]|nr:T9SS type A sorting domain-containing protein [Ignavibacteriaceae bacterium]
MKIFDILGNEVARLVDEFRTAGSYESEFDAEYLPSGIYFYIFRADDFTNAKKMILLR